MPACSFDALLSDPPYGLGFMNKEWDHAVPGPEVWRECLRVLKPGAPLLAFGGTRLYHRLTCAIEDAGFEIRDCLIWMYGSGFPKSLDASKALDKAEGAERVGGAASYRLPGFAIGRSGWQDSLGQFEQLRPQRSRSSSDASRRRVVGREAGHSAIDRTRQALERLRDGAQARVGAHRAREEAAGRHRRREHRALGRRAHRHRRVPHRVRLRW